LDIQQIVNEHFNGNASAMAREFEVTPAAVFHWKEHGLTPQREAQIELWLLKRPAKDEATGQ
jgi:hypothetical protein